MRRCREILRLYSSLRYGTAKSPSSPFDSPGFIIPLSYSFSSNPDGNDDKRSPNSQRDSLLLEKFRLRKLEGSSTTSQGSPQASEKEIEKDLKNEDESSNVVTDFKVLGLCKELIEFLEKLGLLIPTEIQCVGIPAVLKGKSVLMSSVSGPDRILAYLLPLIQLLRQDTKLSQSKLRHPRAIVLCATEEKAELCFNAAKFIIHHTELKSAKGDLPNNEKSDASIGLVIGPPCEILQYIEEGMVIPEEIRYLVLGEESPVIKRPENNHAGHVSAMLLEMDRAEVFQLTESLDALRQKMTEAMNFLK
ncbi:DEAD-box ATP-dependent RNA helicase 39 isoform X2 [Neltuma alba]|uniref:DEAD-box ATP-dependent RNA helicase 39 isoform X2 n=1 Tax=Neltuma alba TaxID=207710 RepID=UPI0010A51AC7|nr:DEAD-box ATP-dependent RNA helicase 39-like isoform X2 [Prosopis alba]